MDDNVVECVAHLVGHVLNLDLFAHNIILKNNYFHVKKLGLPANMTISRKMLEMYLNNTTKYMHGPLQTSFIMLGENL